ncbi:MAG TPA: histidine phosphatase family protein [Candidatus Lambdaproteobacteria bacterium]|jgi:probable phosphoglycerate mutase|uniref:Histidine phosphatase family protein n=2 Tax=SAR324 cluster bacterium TaxID=2024889 RepID=A0A432G344_9DELT|nr:MAG: histidine phosphatase family protein [SAR324 cluster bacterium]HIA34019.1 histidine phosphatase family protein [Candidatus Lambdaproteobacteria bacterium]RTZ80300.1 MAG: histidine phosphatase family protein [SAR324 cluster bacterium]RTZ87868.1 MAG: histidine phosphatase family protein [SAR324 cluster bacterium]HIB16076.1 histidine phosphatase family protein [Candidatus Lambdaproteobacteria bacterium]
MKETEIILIRHGETEWNSQQRMQGHSNSDLSSVGQAQIQALGQWMKNVPFDHIYSSDSLRAKQTAEAITQFSGHELKIDLRLREKNLGVFEGLTSEEARERHPEVFRLFKTAGSKYVIDEGESTQQLQDRALEIVDEIRIKHPEEHVLLVTHGGFIRVVMKHSLGLSLETPTRFLIRNTGVFRLVWEDKWIVSQMGGVSHLE